MDIELQKIKNNNKKRLIFIVLTLIMFLGISLATFYYVNIYNDSRNNILKTGLISIAYTENSENILLENQVPVIDDIGITNTSYEFSVQNTSLIPINMRFQIIPEDINEIPLGAIRYALYINKELIQKDNLGNLENNTFYFLENVSVNKVLDVKIVFWVDYYYEISGQTFAAKIKIIGESFDIIGESKTTVLEETDELLLNPGKGFYLSTRDWYQYENETYDEAFTTIYRRLNWSDIEPEEDVYNWEVIDELIANCEKRGKKLAFGVMNANTSSKNIYITPQWVFDKGATYYEYENTDYDVTQIIPVWTDEIFLNEVNDFVKILGERYNGHDTIAYIDIRSYGNWGEGHLGVIGGESITQEELKNLYIMPYKNAFPDTLLVNVIGTTGFKEMYNWGIDQGIAVRRDGIFNSYDIGLENFLYADGKLPTIFEYYNGYRERKEMGIWSFDDLISEIEKWKPSYTELSLEMYADDPVKSTYIANRIGYYFKLKGANYTNEIETGSEMNFELEFRNEGVTRLYEPCTVYIALLDENNNLIQKYKTNLDPHTWLSDTTVTEKITLNLTGVEVGLYNIAVGLFLNEEDENPTYLLGNEGKTDGNWYVFGQINIF